VEASAAVYFPTGQFPHGLKSNVDLNLPIGHGFCSLVVIFTNEKPIIGASGLEVPAVHDASRLGGHSAVHNELVSPGN
jgi:hypothetical protein